MILAREGWNIGFSFFVDDARLVAIFINCKKWLLISEQAVTLQAGAVPLDWLSLFQWCLTLRGGGGCSGSNHPISSWTNLSMGYQHWNGDLSPSLGMSSLPQAGHLMCFSRREASEGQSKQLLSTLSGLKGPGYMNCHTCQLNSITEQLNNKKWSFISLHLLFCLFLLPPPPAPCALLSPWPYCCLPSLLSLPASCLSRAVFTPGKFFLVLL